MLMPKISDRAPTTQDAGEVGVPWIDKANNDVYFLTSVSPGKVYNWINEYEHKVKVKNERSRTRIKYRIKCKKNKFFIKNLKLINFKDIF